MIDAVILAGGKSSRMKRDKALLPFRGYNSLAQYQYERLKPLFNEVYISSKINKFDFNVKIIYDKSTISSPLIALKSIIEELKKPFFLIAVDMPLVPIYQIKLLLEEFKRNLDFDAYIFKSPRGVEPLCGIYKPEILNIINNNLTENNHKIKDILEKINFNMIKCDNTKCFTNLNYINDYNKLSKTI